MQRISYLQWLFASLLVVGCAGSEPTKSPTQGPGCDAKHPCAAGLSCIEATCKKAGCTVDGDCGQSAACIEGVCAAGECRASSSCLGDDETAGTDDDRSCIGGSCLPMSCPRDGDRCPGTGKEKCDWNSDCGSGRLCFNGTCTSGRCTTDGDCKGLHCHLGLCFNNECSAQKPCTKGRVCAQGLCVTPASASN